MSYQVLNPTSEAAPEALELAPRLHHLTGKTIGVISNGKEGTNGFFAHLEHMLVNQLGVGKVVLRQKSNYSAPAEREIIAAAADWDVAITGIGD